MRSLRTNAATAPAAPSKVCTECGMRKSADTTRFFCSSLTRTQLSDRCRQCVLEEAKRSRLERAARKEHRRDLTRSPTNTTTN